MWSWARLTKLSNWPDGTWQWRVTPKTKQRHPDVRTYPVQVFPGGKDCCTAELLAEQPHSLLATLSLKASLTLWPVLQLQHQLPNQPRPGPSPWKGPGFLCLLCILCVPTAWTFILCGPLRGHLETTNMQAAAEQRGVFTFHPELQLDLRQKQKYCNVYFFSQQW